MSSKQSANKKVEQTDILLVGAGTMSATLGMLLHELDPTLHITMVEALDDVASESSDGWNNAGTGHAGYCELNYTPETETGDIDVQKAIKVNSAFEVSLQFWAYLVQSGVLPKPEQFINQTPHLSFVWGQDNVDFLRRRHAALTQHPLFEDMEFTDDPEQLKQWMPLVMAGRKSDEPMAATRVAYGSDVDFGSLTRYLVDHLKAESTFTLQTQAKVKDLRKLKNGRWEAEIHDWKKNRTRYLAARFVFLGAGGAALPLLHKTGIPEGRGYGGFPVSGQWLVCKKPEIVEKHDAKVYGKAPVGAPPMSVPHLDTRIIDGEKSLLFGPFAGFTTKFLKSGSVTDLARSLNPNNLRPMVTAGLDNMPLTFYLIKEALQGQDSRIDALRRYYPAANDDDWTLAVAGQRVQIIKKAPNSNTGKLEFGTEVIVSDDGSLAALLGASPGASTATDTMLYILDKCFAEQAQSPAWQEHLRAMIPSYGKTLAQEPELLKQVRTHTLQTLQLHEDTQ